MISTCHSLTGSTLLLGCFPPTESRRKNLESRLLSEQSFVGLFYFHCVWIASCASLSFTSEGTLNLPIWVKV
ncbi:hypothetical protein BHE90_010056 [Fusarium euwallaceae]|uniref:Uncharacterized protein n=4 Tax=Fusarium solani species complex TaxID=232080 RepID=A0A3M2S0F6_9HYPO|nr:hypothetical protein CDV36_009308 [Fusarium kuroshium]RSL94041.1 hypothetical protein CEP52_012898 [Fusarium oligoseptatum]RSM01419.1 hypothetical protein CDV31_011352 [Fusarium ambrosium]RTE75499.1 hypothetical protein BHE90_010056 [Fusarium euwallaceae]